MVYLFIGVYIVLAILVYIMFNILKKSVNKVSEQSKTYYVDKLQEYDDLIDSKEEQLDSLDREIKNKRAIIDLNNKKSDMESIDFDINIIDLLSRTNYQNENLFNIEKKINEKFNYNEEKIIQEFLKNLSLNKNYDFCINLKNKLSKNKIYDLKVLTKKELSVRLKEILSKKEYELYKDYIKINNNFNISKFLIFVDELVQLNNPNIIVFVGDKNKNFDYLSKNITTKYDSNIYRGIKILYQTKLYDFSLSGRDL